MTKHLCEVTKSVEGNMHTGGLASYPVYPGNEESHVSVYI